MTEVAGEYTCPRCSKALFGRFRQGPDGEWRFVWFCHLCGFERAILNDSEDESIKEAKKK